MQRPATQQRAKLSGGTLLTIGQLWAKLWLLYRDYRAVISRLFWVVFHGDKEIYGGEFETMY
jgi:hypothetical protein